MGTQTGQLDGPPLIPQFYAGRTVFITGGSGFMGKVLIERLLTTCPDVKRLLILLRVKKGVNPNQRLETLKQSQAFDTLREKDPSQLDKIEALPGDVTRPALGLDDSSIQQMQDVSVVIHLAATVRFTEELPAAVAQNVSSVVHLLDLIDTLPNIQAVVYVSTAYSNAERHEIAERVYPAPRPLSSVLAMPSALPADLVPLVTDRYIAPKPNTYTFTKAMAEAAVDQHGAQNYPVAIFRPTIVVSAVRHPVPGWVEGIGGLTGIVVAAGKGLMHVVRAGKTVRPDLLPVDIAVDTLIAVGWEIAVDRSKSVRVYNCSSGENPTTWSELQKALRVNLREHPLDGAFWFPWAVCVTSKFAKSFLDLILQTGPLLLASNITKLFGIKTKMDLGIAELKLRQLDETLSFFSTRDWRFETANVRQLRERLTSADQRLFNLDPSTIQWEKLYTDLVRGTRKYLMKEKDEDLPQAQRHMRKMYLLHTTTKMMLILMMLYLTMKLTNLWPKLGYLKVTHI